MLFTNMPNVTQQLDTEQELSSDCFIWVESNLLTDSNKYGGQLFEEYTVAQLTKTSKC